MLEKYGWKNNPFDPNLPEPKFLIYKKQTEEIIKRIKEDTLIWINAPMGSGKTTILGYIRDNAQRHGLKALYWHYGSDPSVNEFKAAASMCFKTRFFERFKPKKKVILIDEANYIENPLLFRYLVGLLDNRSIHPSIVFASVTQPPSDILFKTFKDRKIKTIKIEPVGEEDYLKWVEGRIKNAGGKGFTSPFDESIVRKIIGESSTPRNILEKLLDVAYGETTEKITRKPMLAESQPVIYEKEKDVFKRETLLIDDLAGLTEQQKKIIEVLKTGSKTTEEIAATTGGNKRSIRVQLYNLGSMDYIKKKGYRIPFVEKLNKKWWIHKEYKAAEAVEPAPIPMMMRPVKKTVTESISEKERITPLQKEKKMIGEEVVEQTLSKYKAFDGETAIDKEILIDVLCKNLKCDKEEAENIFIELWNRGRVVYTKEKEKVFSVDAPPPHNQLR